MEKPIGLFVGRFQPFHIGHMLVLQGMVKFCRKVVVVIGSSQEKGTEKNPFTAEERKEMVQRALQAEDIIPVFDVSLIPVADQQDDAEWVRIVLEKAKGVEKIWTGDEWTQKCFADSGLEIQEIKEVPGISGTEVRKRLKEGGDWEALLPKDVIKYLKEIKAVDRLKSL